MWEVPEHQEGGVWNLRVNKGYANLLWENLILGFIGEQFSFADEVTGIILNLTAHNDRLSVWMRHGTNQQRVKEIKKDLIKIMCLPQDVKMDFKLFFPDKGDKEEKKHHSKPAEESQAKPKRDNQQRELKKFSVVAAKSKPSRLAPNEARGRTTSQVSVENN